MKIFYRSEWIKGWRGPHEKFFEYFQIQKWMLQRIKAKNIDEENGIICLVPCVTSWVMVLKLSRKVHFWQFCADLNKKSKSLKAIYVYASKSFRYALSEMVLFIMLWLLSWRYWGLKSKDFVKFLLNKYLLWYFNANISWKVAQTPINHAIFWKSIMRTFRCIYGNCFNRLRFLAKVSTKLQKCTFLDNLRTITQKGNMGTR